MRMEQEGPTAREQDLIMGLGGEQNLKADSKARLDRGIGKRTRFEKVESEGTRLDRVNEDQTMFDGVDGGKKT